MITLYFAPRTRATRARWILEESGQPYELVRLDMKAGEHKRPEYLAIHPLGKVPAMRHGGATLFESLGICLYVADRFPEARLAPLPSAPDRAAYCQWMAFSMGTVEPALYAVFRAKDDPDKHAEAMAFFTRLVEIVAAPLSNGPFLLGDRFSAADVMNGAIFGWARSVRLVEKGGIVDEWLQRLRTREAYQRAFAD